jgi:hypothetical protein
MPAGLKCLYRSASAAAVALSLAGGPAGAAQTLVPRIDSFGPYKLGMTLDQAKAAHKGGKSAPCGEIAADRQCIILGAAVFDEPGVIYAVLDASGGKVERIVVQLDPQLTRRRSYRCVRLAEKVFSLLAVVYGSKYKQSYDQNRKPLPAVAWDGALSGRLIFETRCRSADEGDPRIIVVEHHPEGIEPPKVAETTAPKVATIPLPPALAVPSAVVAAPAASGPPAAISAAAPDGAGRRDAEAPVPARAPIGVVEEIKPETNGAAASHGATAALTRELVQAKAQAADKLAPPASAPAAAPAAAPSSAMPASAPAAPAQVASKPAQSIDNSVAARLAPPPAAVSQQTAAVPPVRQAAPSDTEELPEPPDLVAPEPFMVPEEEALFRQRRERPQQAAAAPPSLRSTAAAAPIALLAVTPPPQAERQPVAPQARTQPVRAGEAQGTPPALARTEASPPEAVPPTPRLAPRSFAPVLTGGWRHRAPVPPARPWRERADAVAAGAS